MNCITNSMIPPLEARELQKYRQDGFFIRRALFSPAQVDELRAEFERMHGLGRIEGCFEISTETDQNDVLKRYPRMMHPHRVNQLALEGLLHPGILDMLGDLFEEEPLAAQSMFYWKPPGSRGQALHQDNFYLRVHPGNCIAAWTALDVCDEENGGLVVVPGSHRLSIACPEEADPDLSFSRELVRIPEGMCAVPAEMQPGDVLFFHGSVIHGSSPNRSSDRFRRSFICHYVPASTEKMASYYSPLYARDGTKSPIDVNEEGGPCGTEFDRAPKEPH